MHNGYLKLFLAIVVLSLAGCDSKPVHQKDRYSEKKMLMGTMVKLDVCLDQQSKDQLAAAYNDVWQRLEEISWRMNVYDEKSDVAQINDSFEQPVKVGADTYQLINRSKSFSKQTEGGFDITVWPLISLWRQAAKKNQQPNLAELKKILEATGEHQIKMLPDNHVQVLNPMTQVDLGGIAKGYAIDEAARIFKEYGFEQHFIDAGGDIYVGGQNCRGEAWRIGIRDPREPSKILLMVGVTNAAVTTSGNYNQFIMINDEKWSHIINPKTGFPQKEVISATVIAPTAEEADAYSTALCVLGKEKGLDFIDTLNAQYASLIIREESDKRIVKYGSKNFKKYSIDD